MHSPAQTPGSVCVWGGGGGATCQEVPELASQKGKKLRLALTPGSLSNRGSL